MHILINGYGVPKDILTDRSYHSYLGQVFNYLWDNHRSKKLTIVLCGGHTDMQRPYHRTEAGEMQKWLTPRIKQLKLDKFWKVKTITSGLSALDNLLAAKKLVGKDSILYFCEHTREKKSNVLVRRIYGSRGKVMAIDFDTSAPRYDIATREAMETEDLKHCLRALKSPVWAQKLRAANEMKIEVLRKTPPSVRAREIDRITRQLRKEFLK